MARITLDWAPLAASDNLGWLLIAGGAAATLYMVLRPFMRKKRDPLQNTPLRMSLAHQKSLERDMQNLLVELSDMARQMNAQLDNRATKIELLLDEAATTITALETALANAKSQTSVGHADDAEAILNRLRNGTADNIEVAQLPRREPPQSAALQIAMPPAALHDMPAPLRESVTSKPAEANVEAPIDRYRELYALADAGQSVDEISRQLNRPAGEVELLLKLRGKRAATA